METDALIRSISLRDRHYMLFLGAGASVTSGIPSAYDCIWNWKRQIFLTNNGTVSPTSLGDISLPHVQNRIQRWLDQGLSPKAAKTRALENDMRNADYVVTHGRAADYSVRNG